MNFTEQELEISNKSYTNKDFNTIYPELLDLVKKLTNKWDPTTSNESDPGVVLLKLWAILADKNNYNIDKNVLETFPLSVTLRANAQRLYDMLGYEMHYYQSAITQLTFWYTGSDLNPNPTSTEAESTVKEITIPKFTMVTTTEGDITYTLLQDVVISAVGTPYSDISAIEGTIHNYEVNGVTNITLDNLDSEYRLFFTERNIAENGIFITNSGRGNEFDAAEWTRVSNLESATLGKKIFKFGVLPNTQSCYIQFPQDIGTLIENGLHIKYIRSTGEFGNVQPNALTTLSNKIVPKEFTESEIDSLKGKDINQNITIRNLSATTSGKNPEDLDSAYLNYKKTIGTFNTLVTVQDYERFIYKLVDDLGLPLASNAVVSDRTCDINHTTLVMTLNGSEHERQLLLTDEMTAFDIGLYVLNPMADFDTNDIVLAKYNYDKSFSVHRDMDIVERYIEDNKAINHDYINTQEEGKPFIFKNFYTLHGKVSTYYKVSEQEARDIENNIKLALFKAFNARNVSFGLAVQYEDILKVVETADTRIKTVILNEPNYNVYYMEGSDGNGSVESAKPLDKTNSAQNDAFYQCLLKMILSGHVQLYKFNKDIVFDFGQTNITKYEDVQSITTSATIEPETLGTNGEPNEFSGEVSKNTSVQFYAPNFYTKTQYGSFVNYYLIPNSSPSYVYSCELKDSNDIYISVAFARGTYNEATKEYYYSGKINGDAVCTVLESLLKLNTTITSDKSITYTITKIIKNYTGTGDIELPKDTYYKLGGDNAIQQIFIEYTDSNNTSIRLTLAKGTIVRFTDSSNSVTALKNPKADPKYALEKMMDKKNLDITYYAGTLESSQAIEEIAINEKTIVSTSDPEIPTSIQCMWFTNTIVSENKQTGERSYELFPSNVGEVILQENEYFIYTNAEKTELVMLGSGTKLIRDKNKNSTSLTHKIKLPLSKVIEEGQAAISSADWYIYAAGNNGDLIAQELQIITLGEGAGYKFTSTKDELKSDADISITDGAYCDTYDKKDWQDLTDFKLGSDYGWKAKLNLKLLTAPALPQKLETGQKLTIYYSGEAGSISGKEIEGEAAAEIEIASNALIAASGGKDLDLTSSNDNAINIYTYTKVELPEYSKIINDNLLTPETYAREASGYFNIRITDLAVDPTDPNNPYDKTLTFEFKFASSTSPKILVPIIYNLTKVTNSDTPHTLAYLGDLAPEYSEDDSKWLRAGLLHIPITDGLTIHFKFNTAANLGEDAKKEITDNILIGYPYIVDGSTSGYSDLVKTTLAQLGYDLTKDASVARQLLAKLKEACGDVITFDETYEVLALDAIDTETGNPNTENDLFAPQALWDKNHICNKYTIAQWDSKNSSIKVHSASIKR